MPSPGVQPWQEEVLIYIIIYIMLHVSFEDTVALPRIVAILILVSIDEKARFLADKCPLK